MVTINIFGGPADGTTMEQDEAPEFPTFMLADEGDPQSIHLYGVFQTSPEIVILEYASIIRLRDDFIKWTGKVEDYPGHEDLSEMQIELAKGLLKCYKKAIERRRLEENQ
jgi:hypothetical protein